jgi:hypothetical protein
MPCFASVDPTLCLAFPCVSVLDSGLVHHNSFIYIWDNIRQKSTDTDPCQEQESSVIPLFGQESPVIPVFGQESPVIPVFGQ